MFTVVAWYESIDPAAALVNIAAVPDPHVFVSGDDIRVPDPLGNIIGQAALIDDASAAQARIDSPSLRQISNLDIEPIISGAAVFGSPPEILFHPSSPNPVAVAESLNMLMNSDPAAAEAHYGIVWLSDGPQIPVQGSIHTVRATSGNVGAAGTWVNSALVLSQTLPVGRYQIVGMRARSTTGVAMRLVFVGGLWRPGVPMVNAIADRDLSIFRYGRAGVFGEFDTNQPPTVDILGAAGAAPVILLDIIRVG